MFGDRGLFGQWRLKMMSAFTTGLVASTSMLSAGNPELVVKEIKKELRGDGVSYSFEATDDFDFMSSISDLLKVLPNGDSAEINDGMKLWSMFFEDFGIKDIDGYGSSMAKEGDLFDLDGFMHLKPGNEKSLFWKIIGGKASELTTLKLVPEEAVLSLTFKLDLVSLWQYVKAKAPEINLPEVGNIQEQLKMFEDMAAQNGTPVEEIAKALTTEATLLLTINKDKKMMLPQAPPLPQMAATLILKKNGDFLQNYLEKVLTEAPVTKSEKGNFKVTTINDTLPTGTVPGLAFGKDVIVFSTEIAGLDKVIAAEAGKGLLNSSKFSKYRSLGTVGNGAVYISPDVSKTVTEVTRTLPPEASMVASFYSSMFFQDKTPEFFMLYGKRDNGIKTDMLSSFRMASTQMQSVAVIGILAAMILPALGKARGKAKQARSKSRLKQLGTTIAMYYTDGGSSAFPKDYKKFDIDLHILKSPLDDSSASLQDTIDGNGHYIFLFKPGQNYTGSAETPLAMEKPGLWKDGRVSVVFEDGHVSTFFGNTVEEILKAIKERGF